MMADRYINFITLSILIAVVGLQSCTPNVPYREADKLIEEALDDSLFAGAVLLVGSSEEILHQQAFGYASLMKADGSRLSQPELMTTDHVFDLASLTKVLATTFAVMLLHDKNHLDVDDPVHLHLPAFDTPEKNAITIRHLLTHTSGLMQWYPTFYEAEDAEGRLQFTVSQPLIAPVGEQRKYSDLGFMLLGDIVETISGQRLDEFLRDHLYRPMGLQKTLFNPGEDFPDLVSTSHGNPFEKKMVMDDEFGYTVEVDTSAWKEWRTYTLKGEVNDGNAYYTHGGVAGHAGLFSNAPEVFKLVKLLLNKGRFNDVEFISGETIDLFLSPDEFNNGLGWAMDPAFLQMDSINSRVFGHTGFTGTQILVRPDANRIIILLTNRQHYGVDKHGYYPNVGELRRKLAKLCYEAERIKMKGFCLLLKTDFVIL